MTVIDDFDTEEEDENTHRRMADSAILRVEKVMNEVLKEQQDLKRKFDSHCEKHEQIEQVLDDHEKLLFGDRKSNNGARKGLREKVSEMYDPFINTKKSTGDLFWKLLGLILGAGILLKLGLN